MKTSRISGVVGLLGLVSCAKQPHTADTAASQSQSGADGAAARAEVPHDLAWSASAPILVAKSDAEHDLVSIKDPTIVRFNERYHVYATTAARGGKWSMVYTSFRDFREAPAAPLYYMDRTPGFGGYVAAPQLFYFTPQQKWYLVYQSGPPMFSTADDPGTPSQWTPPAPFFQATPSIIEKNGGWLDFWVICDAKACHLFFSDDKGRFYRSSTSASQFPRGFSEPIVVMEDPEAGRLYEACNVYKLPSGQYLTLIEALDRSSSSRRYFRSWTATSLDGPWTVVHDDATAPFAGERNVTFDGEPWTRDISHGELLRAGYDETMLIDPSSFTYLFQGYPPGHDPADYAAIPWSLGLLESKKAP
jgi:endo-1,4-beta-xylanase